MNEQKKLTQTPVKLPDGREVRYSPGTLACRESDHRKYGFGALILKTRNDAGKSRNFT